MIFKIVDGRSCFYQWDIDRQVSVADPTIKEVHFCNRSEECSLVVEVVDGIANVPNKVLQKGYPVRVFGYDGKATLHEATFEVKARTKPIDYVYTEVEIKNYEDLEKHLDARLDEIAKDGIKADLTGYATEEYVNEAVKNVEVDLTGYATENYVNEAINNSQDAYYLSFLETPVGSENAIEATAEMIEFAEHYGENKNICLFIKDGSNNSISAYVPAIIGGINTRIILTEGSIDAYRILNNSYTRYYKYYLTKKDGQWMQYKELVGKLTIATKEYVDEAVSNIDIPEAPEVDLSSCAKFYTFSSLENPSEADYLKLSAILDAKELNNYYFTVAQNKVLRISYLGGKSVLFVYGFWNGADNTTIYAYQVDADSKTSVLLTSYPLASNSGAGGGLTQEEVQQIVNNTIASLDSDEVEY